MGLGFLLRQKLADLVPFGSPLLQLVQQTRERGASIAERNVDLSTPRFGERLADVTLTTAPEPEGAVIVLLQERGLAQRIDRQLLYRGAVRSMSGMARCPRARDQESARRNPRRRAASGRVRVGRRPLPRSTDL